MGSSLSFPTVDLSGKVVLVTGGNAGIGYETAKSIAGMGAHTIIACRSEEKATAAIDQMKTELGNEFPDKTFTIDAMKLDLSSFRSTKDFVVAFKERQLPLHILINNAGIAHSPRIITDDGFESQFQVNHLSHFLLTLELLPIILDTAQFCGDCRIVIVSSLGQKYGVFDPENMNGDISYGRFKFYCNSKLYNVMHAHALQRRLQQVGITVSTLHPGTVNTEIGIKGYSDSSVIKTTLSVVQTVAKPIMKNPAQGAMTTINCAVNPELNSQQCFYYDSCRPVPSQPLSLDTNLQEQLWDISMKNVKEWLSPELYDKYSNSEKATGLEEQSSESPQEISETSNNETTPAVTNQEEATPTVSQEVNKEESTPTVFQEVDKKEATPNQEEVIIAVTQDSQEIDTVAVSDQESNKEEGTIKEVMESDNEKVNDASLQDTNAKED